MANDRVSSETNAEAQETATEPSKLQLEANENTAPEQRESVRNSSGNDSNSAARTTPELTITGTDRAPTAAERDRLDIAEKQAKVDSLVKSLPEVIQKGDREVVKWLSELADPADRVGVIFDAELIASHLEKYAEKAGYNLNEKGPQGNLSTPEQLAERAVRTTISNLRSDGLVYPGLTNALKSYDQLDARSASNVAKGTPTEQEASTAKPAEIRNQPVTMEDLREGLPVKVAKLGSTDGMLIVPDKIANREAGANGKLLGPVPGHGGDVWWVQHEDGKVAPYSFDELFKNENKAAEQTAVPQEQLKASETANGPMSKTEISAASVSAQDLDKQISRIEDKGLAEELRKSLETLQSSLEKAKNGADSTEASKLIQNWNERITKLTEEKRIEGWNADSYKVSTNPAYAEPNPGEIRFTPSNAEGWKKAMQETIENGVLGGMGYGRALDYAMVNNINAFASDLEKAYDAAKAGTGPAFTKDLIDKIDAANDKLGHSGNSHSMLNLYTIAVAREDVGRAFFQALKDANPDRFGNNTYEKFVEGFDEKFGGTRSAMETPVEAASANQPVSKLNPEAWARLEEKAKAGDLVGYGPDLDPKILQDVANINKVLEQTADAAKAGKGAGLGSELIEKIMNENAKGHSGFSFSAVQRFVVATAREDVGRAVFKALQEERESLKGLTYEQYVQGFDKTYGGASPMNVQKNEHWESVAERAVQQAKESGTRVSFNFNGVDLTVAAGTKVEDISAAYEKGLEQVGKQKALDAQVDRLSDYLKMKTVMGEGAMVAQLKDIAEMSAKDRSLKIDSARIIAELEAAGYKPITGDPRNLENYSNVSSKTYAQAYIGATLAQLQESGKIAPEMVGAIEGYYKLTRAEYAAERTNNAEYERGYSIKETAEGATRLEFLGRFDIYGAINKSIEESKQRNRDVVFDWNGVEVKVSPNSTEQSAYDYWDKTSTAQAEARMGSEEYKMRLAQEIIDSTQARLKKEALIKELPELASQKPGGARDAALMEWFGKLALVNEDARLTPEQNKLVRSLLTSAGYTRPNIPNGDELVKTSNGFARWWIGQGIEMLESHGSIPDKLEWYAQSYKDKFVSAADTTANVVPKQTPAEQGKPYTPEGFRPSTPEPVDTSKPARTEMAGEIAAALKSPESLRTISERVKDRETKSGLEQLDKLDMRMEERSWAAEMLGSGVGKGIAIGIVLNAIVALLLATRGKSPTTTDKPITFSNN